MKPTIFAHRGASGEYAEHTRAAYVQALAEGADGLECDVHLTGDEVLVCIHDNTLDRTSNGTGDVEDQTLDELRSLDFSSWKGAYIPPELGAPSEQLLTLEELLDLARQAGHPLELAIELKHPSPFGMRLEEEVLGFLTRQGWNAETSVVDNITVHFMGFNPDAAKHLLEYGVPPRFLCQLVADVKPEEVKDEIRFDLITAGAVMTLLRRALKEGENMIRDGAVGVAGPGVDYVRDHPDRVREWITSGRIVRVWTVNEPADVQLMHDVGVQEITTDYPARVRSQLDELSRRPDRQDERAGSPLM
ncbi:glycerophosphodiester phosphodiesterase [Arthrobacter roseus]|uniref:glycerophosphodiester phosphodiesterase n=1 Tax=Arthrobacter roseus TaxID=136274 RepID=UPI001962F759|nr:glycerophosphodiester phosphodiesterase family protein [Arthrobacter roseus]MBM7847327.1 glycerophosphoryl diester phosphodiesterase [Arthrobacter roseus]